MTGSTKILTVSYGTFSCTLEGFDDPFGTMRGIAEYFRDLAADDRYFGAEPPTPDVEMLQRIAEKEVQRRVEARMSETGVALAQVTADEEEAGPAPAVEEPQEVAAEAREAAVEKRVAERVREAEPKPEPEVEAAAAEHGPLAHDDEFLLSDEPEDVLAVDPDARPPAEGPAETVAEKLRRIRAVVSRSIEQEATDRSFSEPQAPAAETAPRRDRAMTETIRQITADLAEDEEGETSVEEDTVARPGPAPASGLVSSEAEDADVPETAAEPHVAAAPETMEEPEAETGLLDEDVTEDAEPAEAIAAETRDESAAEEDEDDGWDIDLSGLTEKIKSAESTVEAPETAETTVEREVSEVLRLDAKVEVETEDVGEKDERPASERRPSAPLTPISETGEDVGRLMAETDNHLNDDESVRRRRVISQMRAAVAATKADRLVTRRVSSREAEEQDEQSRYRQDLSEVVRDVSRPLSRETSARKSSAPPLVLVSSQRVDEAESSAVDGERPADFAGFAKSMGAKELPELLEAAAAYASFVEGQPSFSRPEIMKRVARVDPTLNLSREDGLRSFGQLLRQGTFKKLERGQFTISDKTRFKPETRFAGE